MSTIKTTHLQHPSASSPNITLASSGAVEINGSMTGAGLDLITTQSFSAASSVSVDNCFTATYDMYRIQIRLTASSTNLQLRCRTRLSGSDDTANAYFTSAYYIGTTGAAAGSSVGPVTTAGWEVFDATDPADTNSQGYFDLAFPTSGKRKQGAGLFSQQNPSSVGYGVARWFNKSATTNFDGLTFFTNTGTASGSFKIYGYKS
jgi:hypothetical protein